MNDENQINEEPSGTAKSPSLLNNYVSFIGIAIALASLTSFVLLFLVTLTRGHENPYTDLVIFIFVPSVLIFGLFVALVGAILERRRRRRSAPADIAAYPIIDLNDPHRRRTVVVFLCLSFIFLFMTAFGSYRAYEYTESVTF